MKAYDWIVIGAGITGSALSYELIKKGFRVLLLEKDAIFSNATSHSYGGLAYWSGTTDLTRKIFQEGINLHRSLSQELEAKTEFRDLDLILTIDAKDDPQAIVQNYSQFSLSPNLLSVEEACQLEPLLNPHAISGVLRFPHGHINSHKTNQAYQQAFCRLGGEIKIETVVELIRQKDRILGVKTSQQIHHAANTVVCAGGFSRSLLKAAGIHVKIYFTHAQLIQTPPVDIKLNTLVMPATFKRLELEAIATQPENELLWDQAGYELASGSLEVGAIQFLDGHICMGQISQVLTDLEAKLDVHSHEEKIRTAIGRVLPSLATLPGTWHHCLVAFTNSVRPLVGLIPNWRGIYLFSGFTSTLIFAPPLARHFAAWVSGEEDTIMEQLVSG